MIRALDVVVGNSGILFCMLVMPRITKAVVSVFVSPPGLPS